MAGLLSVAIPGRQPRCYRAPEANEGADSRALKGVLALGSEDEKSNLRTYQGLRRPEEGVKGISILG
jgi:hypothetical protein